MIRKYLISLLCFLMITQLFVGVASADKSIQLYVNNEKITRVHPIVKSGVMYVPYRPFFTALGFEVAYDPVTGQISGVIKGSEIKFWAGDDSIQYGRTIYYLDGAIPVLHGQVYLPLRLASDFAKYSVHYDKPNLSVRLKPYGYGEESAIQDLLTKYYETFSPRLLSSDNLKLGYMDREADSETYQPVSGIKVLDFKMTIDWIEFTSPTEARLRVTYIKNTEVLNQSNVYLYNIRYERGQWKIANDALIFSRMEMQL